MVGIDSCTLDNAPFELHKLLLKNEVLILENLVNLDRIQVKAFKVFVFPFKLEGMDGAPCRVVAELP